MLSVDNIHYGVGRKKILQGISTSFAPGMFHVIVGPNGCGKSTFLKVFSGELKPQQGNVLYEDQNVFKLDKTKLAKRRAVLSQQPELHFPLTVEEVVMMGRYPHFGYKPYRHDEEVCREAMAKADISELADRDYLTLSGGEKQRVQFARVLAQIWDKQENNRFLFLDEAVSHLDLKHQKQVLQIAKELCNENVTVIAILHDLNLSLAFGHRILFMKNGTMHYEIKDVIQITPAIIKDIFDVDVSILDRGVGNRPVIVY